MLVQIVVEGQGHRSQFTVTWENVTKVVDSSVYKYSKLITATQTAQISFMWNSYMLSISDGLLYWDFYAAWTPDSKMTLRRTEGNTSILLQMSLNLKQQTSYCSSKVKPVYLYNIASHVHSGTARVNKGSCLIQRRNEPYRLLLPSHTASPFLPHLGTSHSNEDWKLSWSG